MSINDRSRTEAALVDAVGVILAESGFRKVGVNAIARRSGVNKTLIYRYFGSLEGLLRAYASQGDFVPGIEELCGGDVDGMLCLPIGERTRTLFLAYVDALRQRPRTLEIMAWEMVERNEVTAILEEERERLGLMILERLEFPDPVAFLLGTASAHYLLIRARHIRVFSGFDLHEPTLWEELADRLSLLMCSAS